MVLLNAPSIPATATPERISRTGFTPRFHASRYTSTAVASAPAKAAGTSRCPNCGSASITRMPASPPPADTPMMPGAASGLRITPCRIAPETARLPPTSAPRRMRGSRMLKMIW